MTSKGGSISVTVNGETFKCDGRFEPTAPRSNVSIEGTITGVFTMTAAEMAAAEKAWAPTIWRMQWSMMWRVVGALAAYDLRQEQELCSNEGPRWWLDGEPWPGGHGSD